MAQTMLARGQNLFTYSDDLSNAVYTYTGITVPIDATVADPFGGFGSTALTEDGANALHRITSRTPLFTADEVGKVVSLTVWAKKGTETIMVNSVAGLAVGTYDLNAGTSTLGTGLTIASIISAPNGFYKCTNTFVVTSAMVGFGMTVSIRQPTAYQGTLGNKAIYIMGFQKTYANWSGPRVLTTSEALNNGNIRNVTAPAGSQNIMPYSQNLDVWTTAGCSITANTTDTLDPWGTNTAEILVEDGSTGTHRMQTIGGAQNINIGSPQTMSVYVKAGTRSEVYIQNSVNESMTVNLTTGVIDSFVGGTDRGVINAGNGWWRLWITFPAPATSCSLYVYAGNPALSYTGTNLSKALYVSGAQYTRTNWLTAYAQTIATVLDVGNPRNIVAQRQNLVKYSDDISISSAGNWDSIHNATATQNQAVNPMTGTTTAALMSDDSANTYHSISQNSSGTAVPGVVYTYSVLVKRNTIQWIALGLQAPGIVGYFDIQNGVVGNLTGAISSRIDALPGAAGWYWCSITFQPSTMTQVQLYTASANGTVIYPGSSALSLYVAHAQLVVGTWKGPYTQTTTTTVNTGNIRNVVEQRQNLLKYSEAPDNAAWTTTSATWTANNIANPIDGAVTAYKMTEANATAQHRFYSGIAYVSVTIGQTCTASVYVKAGTRNWFYFTQNDGIFAYFNLTTGLNGTVTSGSLTSKALSNGWYRLSWTFQATTAAPNISFGLTSADNTSSGVGDGTGTMYFWGMQLVRANWAGPYVQTTATPVDTGNIRNITAQNQNLLVYSEDQTVGGSWPFTQGAATNFATSGPYGGNATNLVPNAVNTAHYVLQTVNYPSGTYTFSVDMKPNGYGFGRLQITTGGLNPLVYFNLSTGAAGTTSTSAGVTIVNASSRQLPNGYYRCSLTISTIFSVTGIYVVVAQADNVGSFAGDTTSGILIARAQLVAANWPGPYTSTTTAVVNTGNIRSIVP